MKLMLLRIMCKNSLLILFIDTLEKLVTLLTSILRTIYFIRQIS